MKQLFAHEQVDILKKFLSEIPKNQPNWLDGVPYSKAFMICVGAGPWKIGRRQKVQQVIICAESNTKKIWFSLKKNMIKKNLSD